MNMKEMDTRYLVKVHSIEVSTLSESKDGSIVDLQCSSFCDSNTKNLAAVMSESLAFVNLLEEDEKTEYIFLKDVPVWGTFVLALGSYLVGAATRNPSAPETLAKINRVAKAVEGTALLVEELSEASNWVGELLGKPPNPETVNKIKSAATSVATMAVVVKELAGE